MLLNMQTTPPTQRSFNPAALALPLLAAMLLSSVPNAWALYKVVGPDGKVSYTDRPPADAASQRVKTMGSGGVSTAGLPYELAQVVGRFPVVLYAFKSCSGCDQGRQFLKQRGIPFTEKSVDTDADVLALEQLSGSRQMPLLRIGKQQVLGFSSSEWASYLDAAGYPAASVLPKGYNWPAAAPLVASAASSAGKNASSGSSTEPKAQPRPAASNTTPAKPSSGFRF